MTLLRTRVRRRIKGMKGGNSMNGAGGRPVQEQGRANRGEGKAQGLGRLGQGPQGPEPAPAHWTDLGRPGGAVLALLGLALVMVGLTA